VKLAGCFALILFYVPPRLIPISGITGEIIIKPGSAVKAMPCVLDTYLRERGPRAVYADEEDEQFSRSYGRAV